MATIDDLNVSISDMLPDEALKMILRVRKSRLVKKMTKFTLRMDKAANKGKKTRAKKDPLKAVDKEVLLKLLKESMENG